MSRARKVKKAGRDHEYEVTDRHGGLAVMAWGFESERDARRNRRLDKQYVRDPYYSRR